MEYGDASIIQGKQKRLLASYSKIPLLIIDEWLVSDMSDKESIVDRYAHTLFWIEIGSMNMREYCEKNKI